MAVRSVARGLAEERARGRAWVERDPGALLADPQDGQRSTLADFTYYSAGRYLSEALFFLRGLALARILGPSLFGVWAQMKIVLMFLQFGQLGSHDAMLREVPYEVGKGEVECAKRIETTVLSFTLWTSILIAGAIVALVALGLGELSRELQWAWVILALFYLAGQVYSYTQVKLRAQKRFGKASRMMVGFALSSTALGIVSAVVGSIQGFLVACILSYVIVLASASARGSLLGRPRWDGVQLRDLLKTGFPIMAAGSFLIILWNVDKLAIWLLMSRESLGIYALGSYLIVSVMMVPEAFSAVLYPRLMERVAAVKTYDELTVYLTKPTLILSYVICPLLGVLFLAIHLPIDWLLPSYTPVIPAAQILIVALFFMVLARMPHVVLISLNRQRSLLILMAVAIAVGAVLVTALIGAGHGLVGAALGASMSYLVYAALTMAAALWVLRMPLGRALSFLAIACVPCVVAFAAVAAALALLPSEGSGIVSDVFYTALRCLVVLIPAAMLLWGVNKRLRLFQTASA